MEQLTFNPSLDGYVEHDDLSVTPITWHELVTSAGSNHSDVSTSATIGMMWARTTSNKWRRCSRGIFLFNTAALPDDATISSATLQLWCTSIFDGLPATPDLCLYAVTPASDDAFANGDYALFGNAVYSDVLTFAGITDDAYNTFTLNGAGLAAISKTGITRLGVRNANYDVADELDPDNHDPLWHSNNDSFYIFSTRLQAGQQPILTVNYTTAEVATGGIAAGKVTRMFQRM